MEPPPIEAGVAPPPGPYAPGFDAIHYDVTISLPDTGSFIRGRTVATLRRSGAERDTLALDLSGLAVEEVTASGTSTSFRHDDGKLFIPMPASSDAGDQLEVAVTYSGHPDDGLIIGRNVHGQPTAFADNWPNRARYWFPSIDHPSDKARVTFTVQLEEGDDRQVIANGRRATTGSDGAWTWSTDASIPTYTMVIGVAEFAIDTVGEACTQEGCIEVSTWLFPPDRERGAASFTRADEMVSFYSDLIAPFPYEKLAHVQSATRYGGMENVTAIFYPEGAIAEGRDLEWIVAHETAHQWFGDAVTEADWHHLWLSEGFADYFGALFFEHADGVERFSEIMENARQTYLQSTAVQQPIVNPAQDNLFSLLNPNNYDKGAWVLHMLRRQLGDDDFFEGIREYYASNEHETVLTEDLQRALEEASGRSLDRFFQQWVFKPGHPQLQIEWAWHGDDVELRIRQIQPPEWPAFEFPLSLELHLANDTVRTLVDIDERTESFTIPASERPMSIDVDAQGDLLKEIVSVEEIAE